ncbi:MAG TPA: hypothetical protein VHB21_06415 [Minicystis sp.]|nr:hypothetical protein [Minicystis sp.]
MGGTATEEPPAGAAPARAAGGNEEPHEEHEPVAHPLQPPRQTFVVDPNLADVAEEAYDLPECSATTEGPNRLTLHVPTDAAVLSMGQGSTRWIKDKGITARTTTHIHLHTKEAANETMVALGGPTNEGFASFKSVLERSTGYAMVTAHHAYLDAQKQMYLVAREKDVIVRTAGREGKVLVQADNSHVRIGAKEGFITGTSGSVGIYAHPSFHIDDPDYTAAVGENVKTAFEQSWEQTTVKAISAVQSVTGVVTGLIGLGRTYKKVKGDKKEWISAVWPELVVLAAEMLELKEKAQKKPEPEGNVLIAAQHQIGLKAEGELVMFGAEEAQMSTTGGAAMLGKMASVKGLILGSVWGGVMASLKATRNVAIGALTGAVEISGKKEVAIESKEVLIGAHEKSVLAADELAAVFGDAEAYIAADGYGLKAKKTELFLGKLNEAKNYKAAEANDTSIIKMQDSIIEVSNNNGYLKLMNGNVELSTSGDATLQMNGSTVHVMAGGKILLG